MSGSGDVTNICRGEIKHAIYSIGMEDAVIDLIVIQWIMQKLKRDRSRRMNRQFRNSFEDDSAQSA